MTLPCIVCRKELPAVLEDLPNQPYGGTVFTSHGQYGSTVYDPFNPYYRLELNVCDPCLIEAGTAGVVEEVYTKHSAPTEMRLVWPDEERSK